MAVKSHITSPAILGGAIALTGASLSDGMAGSPGIKGVPGAHEAAVLAGKTAYSEAYKVRSPI